MKITIDKNELYSIPEIIVKCKEIDDVLQDIISYIGIADKNMIGEVDGEIFFIPLNSILYFESVDKNVYIYTDKQVYRSSANSIYWRSNWWTPTLRGYLKQRFLI